MSLEAISLKPSSDSPPKQLFIALHGWGANAQDLASLAPMLELPGYQMIFPNAPFPHPQVPQGKAWYELEKPGYPGLEASRQLLKTWLLSLEEKTGIPLQRTIMAGFSQGGAMTLDVGLSLPLAGICSLSGYLHSQPQVSTEKPPVLIVHGRQDQVVPLQLAQRAREELLKLDVEVNYQEFDMGHEIQLEVLDTVKSFVEENQTSP